MVRKGREGSQRHQRAGGGRGEGLGGRGGWGGWAGATVTGCPSKGGVCSRAAKQIRGAHGAQAHERMARG